MSLLVIRNSFTILQISSSDYKAYKKCPFHVISPYPFRYCIQKKAQWTYQTPTISTTGMNRTTSSRVEQKNQLLAFWPRTSLRASRKKTTTLLLACQRTWHLLLYQGIAKVEGCCRREKGFKYSKTIGF